MVLLSHDNKQWASIWIAGVDLIFGPWVDVGQCSLEDQCTGDGDGVGAIESARFLFVKLVGETILELLKGQRQRLADVETGETTLSCESGSRKTPRKAAGEMATVTAETL